MLSKFLLTIGCLLSGNGLVDARKPSDPTPIGAVLTGIGEIDRTRPFIDLMKQARGFSSLQNPTDQNAAVDSEGWPTEDFSIAFMTVGGGASGFQYPPMIINGTYLLTAIGNAKVSPTMEALPGVTVLNQTYNSATNMLTAYIAIDESSTGNVWLNFTSTQRSSSSPVNSGLVNVSFLQPGYTTADNIYTDTFLNHVQRFDILRFLGWTLNGTQTQYNWTDRPSVTQPSYLVGAYGSIGSGVPWEMIIALANKVGCDIWINVPAPVTDNYLTGLANLLADTLDPSLNIYIEYGNECWNGHFICYSINQHLANISVLNDGDPYHFAYDGSNSSDVWRERRYAWMVKNIGDIFSTVFGRENVGQGKRVRNIIAGMGDYATLAMDYFTYLDVVWGPPSTLVSTFTIAPYFGIPTALNNEENCTTDDIINGLNQSLISYDWNWSYNSSNSLAVHVALVSYYGLEFRGYESGPATTGPSYPVALMAKANATVDPRMQGLVETLYTLWYGYGLSVPNIHQAGATTTLAPWGSFGVLYDMTVPVTPKTLGIDAVRTAPRPSLNAGLLLPFQGHNASLTVGYYGTPRNPVEYLPYNTTLTYLLRYDPPSLADERKEIQQQAVSARTMANQVNISIWLSCVTPNVFLEVALGYGNAQILGVPLSKSLSTFIPMSAIFDLPTPPALATLRLRVVNASGYRLLSIDGEVI